MTERKMAKSTKTDVHISKLSLFITHQNKLCLYDLISYNLVCYLKQTKGSQYFCGAAAAAEAAAPFFFFLP